MSSASNLAPRLQSLPPHAARPLIALVFEGLSEDDKQLPSSLLYDSEGSRLFEHVCEQPEYHVTRAEAGLLRTYGAEIAELVGPLAAIVEYGVGAGHASRRLLEVLHQPHSYVPLDLEPSQLARAGRDLHGQFPSLRVYPVCQDFRQFVALPAALARAHRRVAWFPGSTIGNFRPLEAVALLNSVRESMSAGGGLLVGLDLAKDRAVLERACNDAAGAMAAFNRNVLARLNREVDATFDLDTFKHRAVWNAAGKRVEMSLVSLRTQCPTVAGIGVALGAGEEIHTEFSYKHTLDGFAQLARIAGWAVCRTWIDAEHLYVVQYLEAAE
jgi:dimethylhistidine N-methyltransferase